MTSSANRVGFIAALMLVCISLSACANSQAETRRISAQECKQMHGRGNISLEQLRECRFTGKIENQKDTQK